MGVKQGRLQKSLGAMTFGVVRQMDAKEKNLDRTRMAEREQEFQIPIRGTAETIGVWTEVELTFRIEFLPLPGQRDSPYTAPTFTYGAEIQGDPVAVAAAVTEWKMDQRDAIYGCKLRVCAWDPTGVGGMTFKGSLHAIFSGFGAGIENELEDDD